MHPDPARCFEKGMATLSGRNTRTLTGYVITLLDYPRWIIEREVDFTDCQLHGDFVSFDKRCASCSFGPACCWLNAHRETPCPETSLDELIDALDTAVEYLQSPSREGNPHARHCDCDTCTWLHEARSFLRKHRRKH